MVSCKTAGTQQGQSPHGDSRIPHSRGPCCNAQSQGGAKSAARNQRPICPGGNLWPTRQCQSGSAAYCARRASGAHGYTDPWRQKLSGCFGRAVHHIRIAWSGSAKEPRGRIFRRVCTLGADVPPSQLSQMACSCSHSRSGMMGSGFRPSIGSASISSRFVRLKYPAPAHKACCVNRRL